jgi:hypothetical protein
MLVGLLIAWTATAAPAVAGPAPASGLPSTPSPERDESSPAPTQPGTGEQLSAEDEELIRNLDLIENLDLLDTVEVLGAVNTPDTPEEEF